MQRFFIHNFQSVPLFVLKDESIIHQISVVLRSKIGDRCVFFDGKYPTDYVYELINIKKKELHFRGIDIVHKCADKKNISLYQAIPNKFEKLEHIIQKGTEVGISKFCFFRSERSQKMLLSEAKKHRLQKICEEAVEQSGRNLVPQIVFSEALDTIDGQVFLFDISKNDASRLTDVIFAPSLSLVVGPEGGWAEREIHQFIHAGYKKISLGDFVLRTETVGAVVSFFVHQSSSLFSSPLSKK